MNVHFKISLIYITKYDMKNEYTETVIVIVSGIIYFCVIFIRFLNFLSNIVAMLYFTVVLPIIYL